MAVTGSKRSQAPPLALFLVVYMAMMACCVTYATALPCPEGYGLSGGVCTRLSTHCKLANTNLMSSWVTLETETCRTSGGTCKSGKLHYGVAMNECYNRGFHDMDFHTYVNPQHKVRSCVDKLFTRMVNSGNYGNSGTVPVWTYYRHYNKLVSYHFGPKPYVSFSTQDKKYSLCQAIWKYHTNTQKKWSAAIIIQGAKYQMQKFASDTCRSIGYKFMTVQELNEWKKQLSGLAQFLGITPWYEGYIIAKNKLVQVNTNWDLTIGNLMQPQHPVLCFKLCKNDGIMTVNGNCHCTSQFTGQFCEQSQCPPLKPMYAKVSMNGGNHLGAQSTITCEPGMLFEDMTSRERVVTCVATSATHWQWSANINCLSKPGYAPPPISDTVTVTSDGQRYNITYYYMATADFSTHYPINKHPCKCRDYLQPCQLPDCACTRFEESSYQHFTAVQTAVNNMIGKDRLPYVQRKKFGTKTRFSTKSNKGRYIQARRVTGGGWKVFLNTRSYSNYGFSICTMVTKSL